MSSIKDDVHPACACDDPQFLRQIQGLKDVTAAINDGMEMEATDTMAVHVISYAYPSSEAVEQHKHGKEGCFVLKAANVDKPFPTLEMAVQFASTLGTVPGRWSFDHPSNVSLR